MLETIIAIAVLGFIGISLVLKTHTAWKVTKGESFGFRLGATVDALFVEVMRVGFEVVCLVGFVFIVSAALSML